MGNGVLRCGADSQGEAGDKNKDVDGCGNQHCYEEEEMTCLSFSLKIKNRIYFLYHS